MAFTVEQVITKERTVIRKEATSTMNNRDEALHPVLSLSQHQSSFVFPHVPMRGGKL